MGTVVASAKVPGLEGVKLLVVQPLDPQGAPVGEPIVAADHDTMAGVGDQVYFVDKREACLAMPDPFVPVDAAVVAIVDQIDREGSR